MNNYKKEYKKIIKKYKKSFKKLAKEVHPFDALCGLNMFIEHLKFQRDYYKNGYNVVALEVENGMTREEGLSKAIELYELGWDEDSKFRIEFKYFDKKEWSIDGEIHYTPDYSKPLNNLSKEEAFELMKKEIQERKKQFYQVLLEELDTWWD